MNNFKKMSKELLAIFRFGWPIWAIFFWLLLAHAPWREVINSSWRIYNSSPFIMSPLPADRWVKSDGKMKIVAEPLYLSIKPPVFGQYTQIEVGLVYEPGAQVVVELAGLIDRATNSYLWKPIHLSPTEGLVLVPELGLERGGYWYRSAKNFADSLVVDSHRVANFRTDGERMGDGASMGGKRYDFSKTLVEQEADYLFSMVMIEDSEGAKIDSSTFNTSQLIKEKGMYKFLISLPEYQKIPHPQEEMEIIEIRVKFIK